MKLIIKLIFIIIAVFFIDITVYAYTEYKVGDVVSYNGMEFYVIKDSGSKDDSVTMLKAEPLTVDEVNQYGVGHVNRYPDGSNGIAYNENGYGGMVYYSSETCGYVDGSYVKSGCTTDYAQSEVKYVVDAWKNDKVPYATEARLITIDELKNNLGYDVQQECTGSCYPVGKKSDNTPAWVYNSSYWYWTSSLWNDSSSSIWIVTNSNRLGIGSVSNSNNVVVRPVITLKKTTLGNEEEDNKDEGVIDNNPDEVLPDNKNSVDKKETTTKVKVENTYMRQTLIVMILGFISICSGVVIYYLIKNKKIISRR